MRDANEKAAVAKAAAAAEETTPEEWSYESSLARVRARHGSQRGGGGGDTGRGSSSPTRAGESTARGTLARLGAALDATREVVERRHIGGRSGRTKELERVDSVLEMLTRQRRLATMNFEVWQGHSLTPTSEAYDVGGEGRGGISGDALVQLLRRNHEQVSVLHRLSPSRSPTKPEDLEQHTLELSRFYERMQQQSASKEQTIENGGRKKERWLEQGATER